MNIRRSKLFLRAFLVTSFGFGALISGAYADHYWIGFVSNQTVKVNLSSDETNCDSLKTATVNPGKRALITNIYGGTVANCNYGLWAKCPNGTNASYPKNIIDKNNGNIFRVTVDKDSGRCSISL